MSVETQNENKAGSQFGDKKVTQAECAMFVQQALRPLVQRLMVIQNACDVLYGFLAEVGINGVKVTQEEIVAYAQSRNNKDTDKPKDNGTQA
jgi:hypothetical protein